MMPEAKDFKDESDMLAALLADAGDDVFATVTHFKSWKIEDVIGHLQLWNVAAMMALQDPEAFKQFIRDIMGALQTGKGHVDAQYEWLDEHAGRTRGRTLLAAHCGYYPKLAAAYGAADSENRLAWADPDMTTRTKIIARQMET